MGDNSSIINPAVLEFLDARLIIMGLFKWLDVFGILWVVGLLGFWVFILKPGLQSLDNSEQRARLNLRAQAYFNRWWVIGLVFLTLTSLFSLTYDATTMSQSAVWKDLALWRMLLFQTHLGWILLIKMGLLLGLGLLWRFRAIRYREELALGLGFLLCFTASLSGHALDNGYFSVMLVADGLHVISAALWIGGLVQLFLLGRPTLLALERKEAHELLTGLVRCFSRMAVICVVLLMVTGTYSAWSRIPDLGSLVGTLYGITISLKILFAGLMVGMGGLSRFYILPSLCRIRREQGENCSSALQLRQRFFGFIVVESLLAIVVLSCASLLTQTPPPFLIA